jgi:hypothetical protein
VFTIQDEIVCVLTGLCGSLAAKKRLFSTLSSEFLKVSVLIKGVFNSRPPKVVLLPEWDLPLD